MPLEGLGAHMQQPFKNTMQFDYFTLCDLVKRLYNKLCMEPRLDATYHSEM